MNRQIAEFLSRQEEQERQIYRSEEQLRKMIENDFLDSGNIFRTIGEKYRGRENGTVRFFRRTSFFSLQETMPVPVRKCSSFYISKHTMSQVPYFHNHDFYELIYVMQGKCTQWFPGKIPEKSSPAADIPFTFCGAGPRIDYLICMMLSESTGRRIYWEESVKHYLALLFIELMRGPSGQDGEMARRLEQYFELHPDTAALRTFAAEIGYSSAYAGKRIREQTGENFSRNLLDWRMKKAARLLSDTDEPVEAVAAALGYAGRSGLYKQFQERYGMTPGEYRELFRK